MANNTYSWDFHTLQVYTEQAGKEDVVYLVHWYYNAIDETKVYKSSLFGVQQVAPYVSGSPFIPFDQLTQDIVQGWVQTSMGEEQVLKLQASLDQQIEAQINPPIAMLVPPWKITPAPTPTPTPVTPTPTPTLFSPMPTLTLYPPMVTPTPTPTEGYTPPIVTQSFPIPFWTPTPTPTPVDA